jgi:ribose 5-phosphate isomerase B
MINKIYLASDHGGFSLKETIIFFLKEKKLNIQDLGCKSLGPVDYPDYAQLLANRIEHTNSFGIIICGTGIGISIAANRFSYVRAAVCTTVEMASLSRKHNNANVLALGGRIITKELAKEIVFEFLNTKFEGGRHVLRVNKI